MNYSFFFIGGFIQMILVFYMFIVATLLRLFLAEVKSKAFSALSSHLTDVTLFYGSITFIYIPGHINFLHGDNSFVKLHYLLPKKNGSDRFLENLLYKVQGQS
eukprot:bmy_04215T0